MLLVFLPIALGGAGLALVLPAKYEASLRLLATGAVSAAAMRAEAELAGSPMIAERVIRRVGLSRLYPQIAGATADAAPGRLSVIDPAAIEAFEADAAVAARPGSSLLTFAFAHDDPQLAAETLNAFAQTFIEYRREAIAGGGEIGDQRRNVEARLAEADEALRALADANDIREFDAEREALRALRAGLAEQLADAETRLRETEARARGLRRQVADERRTGVGPISQALEIQRSSAQAELDALAARKAELVRQAAEADTKRDLFERLAPEHARLARDHAALAELAQKLADREQGARADIDTAQGGVSFSVYEPARAPQRGFSSRRMIVAGGALIALAAALIVGIARIWSQPGLPTAGSLERTLGVRVLAATRERSA